MTEPLFEQPDAHPAIALYRQWNAVLEAYGSLGEQSAGCAFGPYGWALLREHEDLISFGQQYGPYSSVGTHWHITSDGRFRWGVMWGRLRRARIAQTVPFLTWGYTHGRYQWSASTPGLTSYGWRGLTDWKEPRHYVSEDLLGCRTWRQQARWCVLERHNDEWQIKPALDQSWPGSYDLGLDKDTLKAWERYEKLIERRYLKAENDERIQAGMSPRQLSVRIPTVKDGGTVLPPNQAVSRLVALLEATQPAKTTPLKKRPKEAQHGTDNLAPAHQL